MLHPAGCHGHGGGAVGGGLSGERLPEEGLHRQDTPQPVHGDGRGDGGAYAEPVPDRQQAVPGCVHRLGQRFRGVGVCAEGGERGLRGHGDAVHGLPV